MHKATICFSVDLIKTWDLTETDIANLSTGIQSKVFQQEITKVHSYTKFNECMITNVYVNEKELIFIIQPDWNTVNPNIFEDDDKYLENLLYETVVVTLIGIGKNINDIKRLQHTHSIEYNTDMTLMPFVKVIETFGEKMYSGKKYVCPFCNKNIDEKQIKDDITKIYTVDKTKDPGKDISLYRFHCPHCDATLVIQSVFLGKNFKI